MLEAYKDIMPGISIIGAHSLGGGVAATADAGQFQIVFSSSFVFLHFIDGSNG